MLQLWQAGWQILTVWECETKDPAQLRTILNVFLEPVPGTVNYDLADQHALYEQAAEDREEYSVGKHEGL